MLEAKWISPFYWLVVDVFEIQTEHLISIKIGSLREPFHFPLLKSELPVTLKFHFKFFYCILDREGKE
jgi:hypothetical protein